MKCRYTWCYRYRECGCDGYGEWFDFKICLNECAYWDTCICKAYKKAIKKALEHLEDYDEHERERIIESAKRFGYL